MMKRLVNMCILSMLCLVLLGGSALAAGLPSISGGSLPVIAPPVSGNAGVLPDPADVTGDEGAVFAQDYAYTAGYTCTVYTYPIPQNVQAFAADYQAQAAQNGFAAENTQIDGFDVLKLTYQNRYAMLFPQYNGVMMLMVQNGMAFGEAAPNGSYIAFTRNGRRITTGSDARVSMIKGDGNYSSGETFEVSFHFVEEPVSYFIIEFPAYAQKGDVFRCSKKQKEKLVKFYTEEDEFMVRYDRGNRFAKDKDYFELRITSMVKTSDSVQVEGTFEGSFSGGNLIYEKGSFRAEMER